MKTESRILEVAGNSEKTLGVLLEKKIVLKKN